jgi:hypothetical protein
MKPKHLIYSIFLSLLLNNTIAQNKESNFDTDRFLSAEITLSDGTTKKGYVASFLETQEHIDLEDLMYTSAETTCNLIDKEFEFCEALGEKTKIYNQRDVKQVTLFYSNLIKPKTYKVLELKSLNDKGELKQSSKMVWLPVLKEDKVNIYSFIFWYRNAREKANGETKYSKKRRKMVAMTYLGNSKDNYVLSLSIPFDDDLTNIFHRKKIIANILSHVFRDCPNFIDKIISKDKFNEELYVKDKSAFKEKIKQITNDDNLSQTEKELIIDEITNEMDNQSFFALIEDYKSNCK